MKFGKGTQSLSSYAANLQRAILVRSAGAQLAPTTAPTRIRCVLIHNPYRATVADLGICNFRIGSAV